MLTYGLNSASVLAQVGIGNNLLINLLAIFMAFGGAGLYFLRTIRPELSRDQDIFFAAVGVAYGCILFFQGWRLDPILQFSQFILAGSAAFFVFDSVRLRGIATQQAKRNTPIVDDEREVSDRPEYDNRRTRRSRTYGAERVEVELEPLPYYEDEYEDEPPIRGRIPGGRDSRAPRDDYDYDYDYDDAPRRSSRRSSSSRSSSSRVVREDRRENEPRSKSNRRTNPAPDRYARDDWDTSSSSIEKVDKFGADDWNSEDREERRLPRRDNSSEVGRRNRNRPSISPSASLEDDAYTKRRKGLDDRSFDDRNFDDRNFDDRNFDDRNIDRNNVGLNSPAKEDDVIPTTYVDYKPLDSSEKDSDENINPNSYGEY